MVRFSDEAALAEELSAKKAEAALAVERAETAEKDSERITAELEAVTAELEAATQLTKALALERGAALERAKLAEEERDVLREQLAAKDRELDAANRRGDLAEEECHAALLRSGVSFLTDLEASVSADSKAKAKVMLVKDTKAKQVEYQYGKPVDFCEVAQRWRDDKGRFCRQPSPARRA